MEQNKVEMFIGTMGDKFPSEKLMLMREVLSRMDDNKLPLIQSMEYKNPTTMLIISIFLGSFGVDRFMLGETGLGVAKLLTCGGLWVWYVVDLFIIMNKTKELNYRKFTQVAI